MADDGTNGYELWTNSDGGMTNVTGATCSISPSLPAGLSIDSSTCTISGTPTVETSNTTYTVTAVISNVTYQGSVWLSTSTFGTITSAVEGAALNLGEAMTSITLNYTSQAGNATVYNGNGTAWVISNFSNYDYAQHMEVVGNTIYFAGQTATNGKELWKSDGTTSGTVMVKDINSGNGNGLTSDPAYYGIGNTVYFIADDGTSGFELWKTDGTSSGTTMVKDINSGSASSIINCMSGNNKNWNCVIFNNNFYFLADDGINGKELWKSDGTASGTVMVKDINSGSGDSWASRFVVIGNALYFSATDGIHGMELWKTDGTTSGTVMVKDIGSGSTGSSPRDFEAVGNSLFFSAYGATHGLELWKSDGTTLGTVLVKDINNGTASGMLLTQRTLTAVGDILYFVADDGTNGKELWKSDGTASGTVMVKDIHSGPTYPMYLTAVGDTLYFRAYDATHDYELWKSDGTASGTVMVKDINPSGASLSSENLRAIGNTLFFSANDGTNGVELWKSDGTASGTVMVQDLNPNLLTPIGSQGSTPPSTSLPSTLIPQVMADWNCGL